MPRLLLFTLLSFFVITLNAQQSNIALGDTLELRKVGAGYQFFQGTQQLKMKQVQDILKVNEEALKEFKSAKSSNTFGQILGFAGGFMIGWTIGTAISGGEANWTIGGIGAGLAIISFPIGNGFKRKARNAVNIYNSSLR
jgi:hypothetical protein